MRVVVRAYSVVTPLARQRGLAAGGLVIQRKALEFVLLRGRYCNVAIGPAVGGGQRFVQYCLELAIDSQITPDLGERLPAVPRIEYERTLDLHSETPVAAEFQTERPAFERVDALE